MDRERERERVTYLVFANRYRVERKLLCGNQTTNKTNSKKQFSSKFLKQIRAPKIFLKISFSPTMLTKHVSIDEEKSFHGETNYSRFRFEIKKEKKGKANNNRGINLGILGWNGARERKAKNKTFSRHETIDTFFPYGIDEPYTHEYTQLSTCSVFLRDAYNVLKFPIGDRLVP